MLFIDVADLRHQLLSFADVRAPASILSVEVLF